MICHFIRGGILSFQQQFDSCYCTYCTEKTFRKFIFDSQKFTKLPIEGCKIRYVMNSVTLFIESIQFKDSGSGFKG